MKTLRSRLSEDISDHGAPLNHESENPLEGKAPFPLSDEMPEEERLRACSELLGIPFKNHILEALKFNDTQDIPIHYFKRIGLVPLDTEDGVLTVAINDPLNFQQADELARRVGCKSVKLVLSTLDEIISAINILYDQSTDEAEKVVQDLGEYQSDNQVFSELEEMEDLMDVDNEAPIIRLVNVILTQALKRRASDIHIEPYETAIQVRFRIAYRWTHYHRPGQNQNHGTFT